MLNNRRLREKQKAMRARPHKPRPYDYKNEDDAEQSILRLRKMFEVGMTDEHIANALSLGVPFVQVLRNKQHAQLLHSVPL
jgi:hypothetical protein